ncbi:MAG: hypothetical protein WCG75_04645 [Armatimonadota bacterium]
MSKAGDQYRASYQQTMDQRLSSRVIGSISNPRLTVYGGCFAFVGLVLVILPMFISLGSPIGLTIAGGIFLLFGGALAGYRQEMILYIDRYEIVSGILPFVKRWKGENSSITHLDFGREVLYTGRFRNTPTTCFTTWVCVRELTSPPMRFEALNAPEAFFTESEARKYTDRLAERLKVQVKIREGVRDMKTGQ